jgi:phage protein U
MFAVLGEIVFDVLSSPETLEVSQTWDYAEQRVIEDTSRLQWVGDRLQTITLDLMFHAAFTDPATQLASLIAAASDHSARPLVFGNGDHRGFFVVVSIRTLSKQLGDGGEMISLTVRADLKEWALGVEIDPNAPPRPAFSPIGVVVGSAGTTSGPITVSGASGVASAIAAPTLTYVPPQLAAPGVSSILNNGVGAQSTTTMLPSDVPTKSIVRSAH